MRSAIRAAARLRRSARGGAASPSPPGRPRASSRTGSSSLGLAPSSRRRAPSSDKSVRARRQTSLRRHAGPWPPLARPRRRRSAAPLPRRRSPPSGGETRDVSPAIYRAKMPGGPPFGPLSYPRLVELYRHGRHRSSRPHLTRDVAVPRCRQRYAELARFVEQPGAPLGRRRLHRRRTTVALIDRVLLPTRLFQLALAARDRRPLLPRRRRGRRRSTSSRASPSSSSRPTSASSSASTSSRAVRSSAWRSRWPSAMLPRFNGRLGDALCGLGVLRPIELFRAIHQQMQDRYLEVVPLAQGRGRVRSRRALARGDVPARLRSASTSYCAACATRTRRPGARGHPLAARRGRHRAGRRRCRCASRPSASPTPRRTSSEASRHDVDRATSCAPRAGSPPREETHRAIFCALSCDLCSRSRARWTGVHRRGAARRPDGDPSNGLKERTAGSRRLITPSARARRAFTARALRRGSSAEERAAHRLHRRRRSRRCRRSRGAWRRSPRLPSTAFERS